MLQVDDQTFAWAKDLKWEMREDLAWADIPAPKQKKKTIELHREVLIRLKVRRPIDRNIKIVFKDRDYKNVTFSNLEILCVLYIYDIQSRRYVGYSVDEDVLMWAARMSWFFKDGLPCANGSRVKGQTTLRLAREIMRRKTKRGNLPSNMQVTTLDGEPTNLRFKNLIMTKKGDRTAVAYLRGKYKERMAIETGKYPPND